MSSSRDILDLKAITAEYADQFAKAGPGSSKASRPLKRQKPQDPFDKPNKGLIKRLAAEARNDAKRRHFQDEGGPSKEERQRILERKAKQYEAIKRGDLSGLTAKQIEEAALDLDAISDNSDEEDEEEEDEVEYIDDLGRTRRGPRREAAKYGHVSFAGPSAYEEVLQSNVIHGAQNFFPVYEPDHDVLLRKHREAEEKSRQAHYDTSKEVRTKAAGQYQFSLDEETRAQQMADLKAQRQETERARAEMVNKAAAVQAQRQYKLDERQAMLERKRVQRAGGAEKLRLMREQRATREAEDLLREVEQGL